MGQGDHEGRPYLPYTFLALTLNSCWNQIRFLLQQSLHYGMLLLENVCKNSLKASQEEYGASYAARRIL